MRKPNHPTAGLCFGPILILVALLASCRGGSDSIEVIPPATPTVNCDGTFSLVINYKNRGDSKVIAQGSFGDTADFESIKADSPALSLDAKEQRKMTINGKLKDPCKPGLTTFSLVGAPDVNIAIPALPFKEIHLPSSVAATNGTFQYDVTFVCCPPGAGAAPGPFTIARWSVSGDVTLDSVDPPTVNCPTPQTVRVKGRVRPESAGGTITLGVTDTDPRTCVLPATEVR